MSTSDDFDEKLAASFVGKHLLMGVTYLDHAEEPIEQTQLHGRIVRINPRESVVVALSDGGEFKLPPDLRSFQVARPGEYRLRSTGEVVIDPDLMCTWVIKKAAH